MKINCFWMCCGFGLAGSAGLMGQETTLAPTVVTAESLEEGTLLRDDLDLFKPESIDDLSGLVPGFHVVSSDSAGYGSVFTMRGSGNVLFFGPPAVGVTLDGVPQGNAFAYPTELLELESVRIHRGPQGAYFGGNAPAGMVELRTPGPTEEFEMRLGMEYGSYDSMSTTLRTSGPLGEHLSHTMQLYYSERDGFIKNSLAGKELDDRSVFGGMAKIFWTPNDRFESWLSFTGEKIDDGSQRLSSIANPFASPDPFTVASDRPGETQIERYSLNSFGARTFDWGTITSEGGISWWDLDPGTVDLDLSYPAINGGEDAYSHIRQSQDVFTREIRYDSPEEAAIRWQAGLNFQTIDNEGTAFRQLKPAGGNLPVAFQETTDFEIEDRNFAFYANATYDLTSAVSVDGGVRVDYHESEIDRLKTDTFGGFAEVDGDLDDVYVSPTLRVNYVASDSLSFFVRSGLGIKPAGFTAYSDSLDSARYDEETNWANEIGLEYTPCDSVRFGLRGYWNFIDDYQVNQSLATSSDFVISNADEVTAKGIEAELSWQPMDRLTIRGAVGYTNTEFDDYSFTDPGGPDGRGGVVPPFTTEFDDNRVPYVPEFTGSLGARYDLGKGFYVQSSARMTGKTYYDSAGSEEFAEDAYVVWNAQVGYEAESFSVAVYGNNLLDEEYYTFINPQIYAGSPGDPQIFGVRVTKEF